MYAKQNSRISWPVQFVASVGLLALLNIVLFCVTGYFDVPDWNWDMERLLPFVHLNRLQTGSFLWEIKLQRLPGFFPLYPIAFVFSKIFGSYPLVLIQSVIFASALLVQSLVVCLTSFVLRLKCSPVIISLTIVSAQIIFSLVLPSYGSYVNAAFRLNWHGDTSLINILLMLLVLAIYRRREQRCSSRPDILSLSLLSSVAFLGSFTSSLFLLVVVFPLAIVSFLKTFLSDSNSLATSFKKSGNGFLTWLNRICQKQQCYPSSIVLLSSTLGFVGVKLLREGCTPTVVGDPEITRAAMLALLSWNSPLTVVCISCVLWAVIFHCSSTWSAPFDRSVVRNIFALHLSVPFLLLVYVFTSYGDVSVFYRYAGIYAFTLPIGASVLVLCLAQGYLRATLLFAVSLLFVAFARPYAFGKELSLWSKYQNPLHPRLLKAYAELGYVVSRSPRTQLDILVTDGLGNIATAPVLEVLSAHSVRYSQLAATADPRLFDQAREEFVHNKSKTALSASQLTTSDVRNYENILSSTRVLADQKRLLGAPSRVVKLGVSDGPHEYVLLNYKSPRNDVLKSHLASYLNRNQDISCNQGVSWFVAIRRFVFG